MNTLKTTALLAAMTAILLVGGQAIGGQRGLVMAIGIAVVMNGISYFTSDKIALSMSGAVPVTREQAPRLYSIVDRLCGKSGIPMPNVFLIPQDAPNAFATGRNPSHASIAVTEGLLRLMNEEEVEGVIAHELSHV